MTGKTEGVIYTAMFRKSDDSSEKPILWYHLYVLYDLGKATIRPGTLFLFMSWIEL